ncbi:WLM domain-containing protein [Balamuthia mandrillaris]
MEEKEGSVLQLLVQYGKDKLSVEAEAAATLRAFKQRLASLTGVPPENQKLLFKGQANPKEESTLRELGLKNNAKIMLVGSTSDAAKKVAAEKASIMPFELRPNVRDNRGEQTTLPKRFSYISVLPMPKEREAKAILERLASDPAILYVMENQNWHVTYLKELSLEQEDKLGWNVNYGLEISLRLRVDKNNPNTFRDYESIRDVLLHELTHIVFGPHDASFFRLNRLLQESVREFERKYGRDGAKAFSAAERQKVKLMEETARRSGVALGGTTGENSLHLAFTPQQMALAAAEMRLSQQEKEITEGCGGVLNKEEAKTKEEEAEEKSTHHQH